MLPKLPSKASTNLGAIQIALIAEIQTDEFWQDISVETLEMVRKSLRDLVQLIEPHERKIVYTDFVDEIGIGADIELEHVSPGLDKVRFRMKVRRFIEKHQNHIAFQKLRRAEQLTPTDITELERMFSAESTADAGAWDEIAQAGGLGLFLRSLVGLDRKAAKEAFATFLNGRKLTVAQTEFLDQIIDFLTEKGMIDPRRFYESPFTDFDDQGISGVFLQADVQEIVRIVKQIRDTAAA